MSSLERRLERLEAVKEKDATSGWEVPIATRVYLTTIARQQARREGKEPPPYTQEEIEERRRWDLETTEGRGTQAHYRNAPGWQSEEAQALLDFWERDAQRRVEKAKNLPPKRWGEVWGVDDEE